MINLQSSQPEYSQDRTSTTNSGGPDQKGGQNSGGARGSVFTGGDSQDRLDVAVEESFDASGGTYGSPRVLTDLREVGWQVSKKTVEASMRRQGLVGRAKKQRRSLTKQGKRPAAPDLLNRDFAADRPDVKWCGDFKQIDTVEGPCFLATVEDLFSRRMLGFALSDAYPTAELASAAINMAVAVRGGDISGVIFHSDRGTQYTADEFAKACKKLEITQSMGRVGSALDNAVAESFFSTLEHELLTRNRYATRVEARRAVARWIDQFYNPKRRHSTNQMMSPIDYDNAANVTDTTPKAA
ncbi:MAG: IS3 family transposase [bacterium]|nr:IS3 family transposase [bacterium]